MDPQKLKIEFSEELRGKNAANFWIGVGVVALAVWLWWNGWFSAAAAFLGIEPAKTSDGLGSASGVVSMLVDTACLIGLVATAVFKFCWRFFSALAERFGFVTSGVLSWAAKERADVPADRTLSALQSHEKRLRELETAVLGDELSEPEPFKAGVAEIDTQTELMKANQKIAELQRELNRMKQQAADVQAARERHQIVSGDVRNASPATASAPAPANPQA